MWQLPYSDDPSVTRSREDLVTARIAQLTADRLFAEYGITSRAVAEARLQDVRAANEPGEIEVWKAVGNALDRLIKKDKC